MQECQQHIGRMVAQLATEGAMDLVVFLGQVQPIVGASMLHWTQR